MDLLPDLPGEAAGSLAPLRTTVNCLVFFSRLTGEAARLLRGSSALEDQVA